MLPYKLRVENELVALAQQGDTVAFAELYGRHSPDLLRFLRARIQPQTADDIAQQTWLKVWTNLARFENNSFRGFLFTVARNLLNDNRRTTKRSEPVEGIATVVDNPEHLVEAQEFQEQFRRCLSRLSERERRLVEESVGRKTGNIAEEMGEAVEKVYKDLHRARKKMQDCLAGWEVK